MKKLLGEEIIEMQSVFKAAGTNKAGQDKLQPLPDDLLEKVSGGWSDGGHIKFNKSIIKW